MTNRAERRKAMKLRELREQAVEEQSHLASLELELEDGSSIEIPHPLLLDDDQQRRYEHVAAGAGFDRGEDGKLVEPHQVKGKLAEPHSVRLAKAILGDVEHARFVKAGGHSNDVALAWQLMAESKERAHPGADPKDTGSASSS